METFSIMNINLTDATMEETESLILQKITAKLDKETVIYFVNAHTLNTSFQNEEFTKTLNTADYVFGDGTGVRWASKILYKQEPRDNVNGTDLIPRILRDKRFSKCRCYILGATQEEITKAADFFKKNFTQWELAGFHHGYIINQDCSEIIKEINDSKPDLLLVGMGNPLQEEWIKKYRKDLKVSVIAGTGGLFTYWAGSLVRAPLWIRKIGLEWLHILSRQPGQKWKRYLIGNFLFIYRIFQEKKLRKL